jgi:hypothetical protein
MLNSTKHITLTKERGKLHNGKLNDLYSPSNIVRVIKFKRMRLEGHVVRTGERRGVYRDLAGNPEGKRHLGDPGVEGRIILNGFLGSGMWGMDWIELAQDRDKWRTLVMAVMNFRVP